MSSFFGDMLRPITERGRQLLWSVASRQNGKDAIGAIEARCEAFCPAGAKRPSWRLRDEILGCWRGLDEASQLQFMRMLTEKFGPRTDRLMQLPAPIWRHEAPRLWLNYMKQLSHGGRN